jgi:hypothetical protein
MMREEWDPCKIPGLEPAVVARGCCWGNSGGHSKNPSESTAPKGGVVKEEEKEK